MVGDHEIMAIPFPIMVTGTALEPARIVPLTVADDIFASLFNAQGVITTTVLQCLLP